MVLTARLTWPAASGTQQWGYQPTGSMGGTIMLRCASSKWLAGLALAIVVLAGVSIIIASLERRGEQSLFPEGTPERTVQQYLLAIEKGETGAAYGFLGPEVQETCDSQRFRESLRGIRGDGFLGRNTQGHVRRRP